MPQPGSILGQITEEFEQIGKQVVQEVVKVPKDIAGKALESLGASSGGKKGQGNPPAGGQAQQDQKAGEKGPLDQLREAKDQKIKQAIARAALEQIAGVRPKQKEPTVWEKIQMEAEQKKELAAKQAKQTQAQALPQATSKRKRGDLYGTQAKKTSAENKNVRQD